LCIVPFAPGGRKEYDIVGGMHPWCTTGASSPSNINMKAPYASWCIVSPSLC